MTSQNSNILISHIYNSRKTVLELMEKQGYNINDYANFSINEVNSMKQNNQLDMLLETSDDKVTPEFPKKKIYIRYYLASRPAPKNIQEMIDDLYVLTETLKKTDTLFIIIKDEPNETLINEIKHIWEADGIFIVIESIKRLQFNILEHILVPPHRVLSDSEVETMMKRYNVIDKTQLPNISRFDPVARVIGLRPGQVCEIIRPSKTSIESLYYRICT
jgi:DNA-directed RNA polymerase I, II, and III subunit RPABC1